MKKLILTISLILAFSGGVNAQSALEDYQIRTGKAVTKISATTSSATTNVIAAVPSGAVMAFDLGGRCPNGWSKWSRANGRVIIGSGSYDGERYNDRQIGGENKTTISAENIKKGPAQISSMSLKVKENKTPPYVAVADTSVVSKECINREKHCSRYPPRPYTVQIGSDDAEPVENRQPFIALTYCRKK